MFVFFFNDTATTEIYTLSLHDALPIYVNPVTLDTYLVQSFIGNSSGVVDIPITIYSNTSGTINVSDIKYDYTGGNDTISILVFNATNVVDKLVDRKSTRLNSSHIPLSRMPSSA